jgi:16S rRNA (uracil1498-N3)-methyltransferase
VDEALRRSAAHVLVPDVDSPVPDEAAAHHLGRVLRLRDGAAVTVTDGRGRWRRARWARDGLAPDGEIVVVPAAAPVTIAVAPPKGERLEWLVQKVTEVGAACIVLVEAERSVVRWTAERGGRQLGRLRRIAVEAALQSRRVWLPELCGPLPATEILPRSVIGEPGGRAVRRGDTTIAIGPEGGWTPTELALATDHVSLGPHVLRVETAAVVAVALMMTAAHR